MHLWWLLQHGKCSHCEIYWLWAGNHPVAPLTRAAGVLHNHKGEMLCMRVLKGACDAERGRDIFLRDPKPSRFKTEKNNWICHNLETTIGWGTAYWCTTLVRILWNYKGTNSWPPQHTFTNLLHNTVDCGASLPGCEIPMLWLLPRLTCQHKDDCQSFWLICLFQSQQMQNIMRTCARKEAPRGLD